MAGNNAARESRSMSHDGAEDSGSESHMGEANSASVPGKPGRKKNPNSQAARRDQNRIAQREFRLRKQQRIRDLEARVEILSGTKDETYSELRNILKDLMEENQTLRNIIRSLSGFIGEGIGGVLPNLGYDRPQEFMDFLNKAETDTAFEGFQKRKKAAATGSSGPSIGQKRAVEGDNESAAKRVKVGMDYSNATSSSTKDSDRFSSLLMPISPAAHTTPFFPPAQTASRTTHDVGLFSDLVHGQNNASTMFMASPATDGFSGSSVSTPPPFQQSFHSNLTVNQPLSNNTSYAPNPAPSVVRTESPEVDDDRPEDPKHQEAIKLIHYHLDNYKRNNAYCLPQSLRPTLVQRTVPHEGVIDGIIHPDLRDRMVLLRGRFDLVDCLHDYVRSLTIHGDDVLTHSNWELSESWLRQFGFLVDHSLLAVCNRWRRDRGDPELSLSDINPGAEQSQNQ